MAEEDLKDQRQGQSGNRDNPEGSPLPDLELVARCKTGDTVAYDELINRYKNKVYGLIYHMTSNADDSHDLMLEVFEKAYFSIKKFKEKSSFSTWLYQVTRNHVLNYLQKCKNQSGLMLNPIDSEAAANEELKEFISPASTEREIKLRELQKKLNESLLKLSEEYRLVVVLHDIEGLTSAEIGKITGSSEGTVRSRLHYARQQLQKYLKEYLN